MRAWLALPVALVVALPTHLVVRAAPAPPAATHGVAPSTDARADRIAALVAEAARIERACGELEQRIAARVPRPRDPAPAAPSASEASIEAAVRAWLAERAAAPGAERVDAKRVVSAAPDGGAPEEPRATRMSLAEIRAFLDARHPFDDECQVLFEELRAAGRMEELLDAARERALEHPDDPEAHLAHGMTALQSLLGAPPTPATGLLAMESDAAFDRALEIDPEHVDARFTKAVSLANWPAFMGKTGEAIENFEVLIRQTSSPGDPRAFPEMFTFLGNLYDRLGEREQALDVWTSGLARFPDDDELRRQIDLARGTLDEE